MPAISPTTLLVTGSMSITLSPAAFVWTMRMVAARSVTVAGIARMARDASMLAVSLVFMAPHFSRTGARSKLPPVSTAGPSCHPWTSPGCPKSGATASHRSPGGQAYGASGMASLVHRVAGGRSASVHVVIGLRHVQSAGAAAPRGEAAGPCPLHHVPLDRHRLPAGAPPGGPR